MDFFNKHHKEIGIFLIIILIYFFIRVFNLTLQPIFADEAIYIRWAQIMKSEPTLRFISLSDGKTPLFMWLMTPLFKIFNDPLLAGRFLSVIAGFFSLLGIFCVSWKVFGKKYALLSSFLYSIIPYSVFFDRMALTDSMLAAFSIWSLFFIILLFKNQRLDLAMILGYLLGGAILTKTPGMVNLLILPVTILGFDFKKQRKKSLIKLLFYFSISTLIALFMYNLLRLGPDFNHLSPRNSDYMFSPMQVLSRPLDPLLSHLEKIKDWFPKLLTWQVLFFILVGSILIVVKKIKLGLVILVWALIPLIIQSFILKTFTARYLFFSIPPLLIISSFGFFGLFEKNKLKSILVLIILFAALIQAGFFDYKLITDPENAPLPDDERRGYFEEWTAGYGLKDIANFLIEKKQQGSVVVGTEGYFGTLPDGLYIYLDKANITIIGDKSTISTQLRDATKDNQVYFIANKNRVGEQIKGTVLLKKYPKAKPLETKNSQDAILLFEVLQ